MKKHEKDQQVNIESHYPKVNYYDRQIKTNLSWILIFLLISIVSFPLLVWVFYHSALIDFFNVIFIFTLIILLLVCSEYCYGFYVHRNTPYLLMAIGTSLSFVILTIGYLDHEHDDLVWTIIEDLLQIAGRWYFPFIYSTVGISIVFMTLGAKSLQQLQSLSIYPKVIASAERITDEYLDGYSERPVSTMVIDYKEEVMQGFIRFLLKFILISNYKMDKKTSTLNFPACESWRSFPFRKKSYIRIHDNGDSEVYITPEDYYFLKVPISYHLLCVNVAERIRKAYTLFEKGDEVGALAVFEVEKTLKKGMVD